MASERALRRALKKNLKDCIILNIEDRFQSGIPDCHILFSSGTQCWVELKQLDDWPVRRTTTTNLGLTIPQGNFLFRYHTYDGNSYLLVQTPRSMLLFQGLYGRHIANKLTRDELNHIAHKRWSKQDFTFPKLRAILDSHNPTTV